MRRRAMNITDDACQASASLTRTGKQLEWRRAQALSFSRPLIQLCCMEPSPRLLTGLSRVFTV